jgi:hypothetical protein
MTDDNEHDYWGEIKSTLLPNKKPIDPNAEGQEGAEGADGSEAADAEDDAGVDDADDAELSFAERAAKINGQKHFLSAFRGAGDAGKLDLSGEKTLPPNKREDDLDKKANKIIQKHAKLENPQGEFKLSKENQKEFDEKYPDLANDKKGTLEDDLK